MRRLYAFLVGIDAYPIGNRLAGCVEDIREYQEFLTHRVDRKTHDLQLRVLLNDAATRAAVMQGFEEHLSQAGPEDTALFVYCGHGGYITTDVATMKIEPDGMNETLVCYDSRMPGGSDLSDKVLAQLLAQAGSRGAHMVVVLDCCHSASGTRGLGYRSAGGRSDPGPDGSAPSSGPAKRGGSGWLVPPAARHVLLAACESHELAQEVYVGSRIRGAFSVALLEALQTSRGPLNYRSLMQSAKANVQAKTTRQHPQLEAYDSADLELPFLGGAVAALPRQLSVDLDHERGWMVNLGAVHGLRDLPGGEALLLLFGRGTPAQQMKGIENAAGRARVSQVFPAASRVELDFVPDHSQAGFEALIEELPVPLTTVALEGDPAGVSEVRDAIRTMGPAGGPSPFLVEAEQGATLRLRATVRFYEICRDGEDLPVTTVPRAGAGAALLAASRLEHIACWQQVKEGIRNGTSSIDRKHIEVILKHDGKVLEQPDCRLEYREEAGEWKAPGLEICVRNAGSRRLYFGILILTESFEIAPLLEEGSVGLDSYDSLWPRGGNLLDANVPHWMIRRGGTETVDTMKLLVSTSPFDIRPLRQSELESPASRSRGGGFEPAGFKRFLNRMRTRGLELAGGSSPMDAWLALDFTVTTVRPHPWQTLGTSGVTLPAGVSVTAPEGFSARVRLGSENSGEADAARTAAGGGRVCFLEPFGSDPGLAVLEMDTVSGAERVTPATPIRISTAVRLQTGDRIAAYVLADSLRTPVGVSAPSGGDAVVWIERLPERSSLNGALRILFSRSA